MQKLMSKSGFAELAGVNPSTITRLVKTVLKAAVYAKGIDAAHPDAVEYLASRTKKSAEPLADGIDPLYQEAVDLCREKGRFNPGVIQRGLGMGYARAVKIFELIEATGVPQEPAPPPTKQAPKPRGQAAVKEAKKRAQPDDMIYEVPDDIERFGDMTLRELVERFGTDARFVDWLKATQTIEAINEKRLKNAQTQGKLVSRDLIRTGVIDPIDSAHIKLLTDGAKTIAKRVPAMHDAGRDQGEIEKFVADQITSFIRPVKSRVARALRNA